jgi:hypothetical protein
MANLVQYAVTIHIITDFKVINISSTFLMNSVLCEIEMCVFLGNNTILAE